MITSSISDRTHGNLMTRFSEKEQKGADFLVIDGNQGNKVSLNAMSLRIIQVRLTISVLISSRANKSERVH